MEQYLTTLIGTVVVCQIASMLAPERESLRRELGVVCALVVMLTLLSPLSALIERHEAIADAVRDFFTKAEAREITQDNPTALGYTLLAYLEKNPALDAASAEVVLYTDESGTLTAVHINGVRGAYIERESAAADLSEALGVPVELSAAEEEP